MNKHLHGKATEGTGEKTRPGVTSTAATRVMSYHWSDTKKPPQEPRESSFIQQARQDTGL